MHTKRRALAIAALAFVVAFPCLGQSAATPSQGNLKGINQEGVPVMFGDAKTLAGVGFGLTQGTGQFGAPTVYACFYNYHTGVIAAFPPNISSGWIETDQKWNPSCDQPGTLPSPNWSEMTYFLDLPVGTVLRVCTNGYVWPGNWEPVGYAWDATHCGYWPYGVPSAGMPSVMYIKRVN